jgi:hypothetical protein
MANTNGWGDGAANNTIGWGQGANNAIGWGDIHADSWAGATDIVGITTDADAQAFITAAAITDATQQAAINTLVLDLKGYSLWTKIKALYPFVGGTASTHKFNLKDPRDLDAAFRGVFVGGWTHSSNGALPNGTNAYMDTKLTPSTSLGQNSQNIGYYSRTNSNGLEVEIGGQNISSTIRSYVISRFSGISYFNINAATDSTVANANSQGFFTANRTASNVINGWKNGIKVLNSATISTGNFNGSIWVGAFNNLNGPTYYYSTRQCALAFISDGLTDAEALNFYTAVQAFQTTLGRNV